MTALFADTSLYSDNVRCVRSKSLIGKADDTYELVKIPRYGKVFEVKIEIISAYGTTSAITVGWKGNKETADPDGFMTSPGIDPDGPGAPRMVSSLQQAITVPASGGKWFNNAPGAVTLTLTKGNAAATANCRVWVYFTVIH